MVSKFAGTAIIRLTSISVLSSWVDADKVHPINKRRFLSEKHAKQPGSEVKAAGVPHLHFSQVLHCGLNKLRRRVPLLSQQLLLLLLA